jgi:hypothetical protein
VLRFCHAREMLCSGVLLVDGFLGRGRFGFLGSRIFVGNPDFRVIVRDTLLS